MAIERCRDLADGFPIGEIAQVEAGHLASEEGLSTLEIAKQSDLMVQPTGASADDLSLAILTFARGVSGGERLRGTIGSLSLNCAKIDARTQEACAEIGNLRQELAVATEARTLEARVIRPGLAFPDVFPVLRRVG